MAEPRCSAADPLGAERAEKDGAGVLDPIEWASRFRAQSARERVPVSGSLELTHRCNLDCIHCYLGTRKEREAGRGSELETPEILDLLQQMTDAGCLNLLLTGGDPMIRPDFAEIYARARRLGLLVTVFCNGTLVTDAVVDQFRRLPPQMVEISLYGSRASTHDRVTRMPGSFETTITAVERLTDAGVRVGLKTVLMTLNQLELDSMRQKARRLGLPFRMDAAIMPCLGQSARKPEDYRVDARRAVELELEDDATRESWHRYAARIPAAPTTNRLYQCGAGTTNFAISPDGRLSPCLVMPQAGLTLRDRSFAAVWADEIAQSIARPAPPDYPCHRCTVRASCTACPATHRLDTGREDVPADQSCASARHRWQLVGLAENDRTMGTETS
jgi:radical SAM protein with 4Fe4S-binding SPASM domain